jgi:hypothetical protein
MVIATKHEPLTSKRVERVFPVPPTEAQELKKKLKTQEASRTSHFFSRSIDHKAPYDQRVVNAFQAFQFYIPEFVRRVEDESMHPRLAEYLEEALWDFCIDEFKSKERNSKITIKLNQFLRKKLMSFLKQNYPKSELTMQSKAFFYSTLNKHAKSDATPKQKARNFANEIYSHKTHGFDKYIPFGLIEHSTSSQETTPSQIFGYLVNLAEEHFKYGKPVVVEEVFETVVDIHNSFTEGASKEYNLGRRSAEVIARVQSPSLFKEGFDTSIALAKGDFEEIFDLVKQDILRDSPDNAELLARNLMICRLYFDLYIPRAFNDTEIEEILALQYSKKDINLIDIKESCLKFLSEESDCDLDELGIIEHAIEKDVNVSQNLKNKVQTFINNYSQRQLDIKGYNFSEKLAYVVPYLMLKLGLDLSVKSKRTEQLNMAYLASLFDLSGKRISQIINSLKPYFQKYFDLPGQNLDSFVQLKEVLEKRKIIDVQYRVGFFTSSVEFEKRDDKGHDRLFINLNFRDLEAVESPSELMQHLIQKAVNLEANSINLVVYKQGRATLQLKGKNLSTRKSWDTLQSIISLREKHSLGLITAEDLKKEFNRLKKLTTPILVEPSNNLGQRARRIKAEFISLRDYILSLSA